ncbi:MAG TPA: glyoxalase superfamily protein [Edaphobacter sp.]|nr:glyoxalase superfamily protein [Edaphobacter sp.]
MAMKSSRPVLRAKVFIEVDDLDCLHRELADRQNRHMRPGIEATDWGRILTVIDPFGNKLVFVAGAISKEQEL